MEFLSITSSDGMATARVSRFSTQGGIGEYHAIVAADAPRAPFAEQMAAVAQMIDTVQRSLPRAARLVFARFFLTDAVNQAAMVPALKGCSISVVEQPLLNGSKVAAWLYFQDDMETELLPSGMLAARHGAYTHLWRGAMSAPDLSSEVATVAMLSDYATDLSNMGLSLADNCLRTWFFVHDVDINYHGMVVGRNDVFACNGLTSDTHFLASTGIGGKNPDPRVLVTLDTYAVGGISPDQVKYIQAPTHLNPTYEYGVAFERATAVDYGDRRHLFISGTASINNKGEVMHPGDIASQTERMLENIGALLSAADCRWADVTHGIVYLRDVADYLVVSEMLKERLPQLPLVIVLAPVCRHGWLVEMECMAIRESSSPYPSL